MRLDNSRFAGFITDTGNQSAVSACRAIVKAEESPNPLVLYGETGCGKTHLLMAMKQEIERLFPQKKVCCITCEVLVTDLISLLYKKEKQSDEIRLLTDKYRPYDVILVDTIEHLEGKKTTQQVILSWLGGLWEDKKQIVLASCLPPQRLPFLFDRFADRFPGGMLCPIAPASCDLKRRYTESRAVALGLSLTEDAIERYAKQYLTVGAIEGAMLKYALLSSQGMPLQA